MFNCNCDFDSSDYNRFGDIGYYLPLTYQIYYGSKNQVIDQETPTPEPPDDEDKVRVEGDTLIIPGDFEVAYVSNDTLIIQNENVDVTGVTLNFINK